MLFGPRVEQSRTAFVLSFCIGVVLTLALAAAPYACLTTIDAAYADTPAVQSASATAKDVEAQRATAQKDNATSTTPEAQKGTESDADSTQPVEKKETINWGNVILQIVATTICLGLLATFFYVVLRKTNRNISDMDNMFK